MGIETAHLLIAALGVVAAALAAFASFLSLTTRRSQQRIEITLNGRMDALLKAISDTPQS